MFKFSASNTKELRESLEMFDSNVGFSELLLDKAEIIVATIDTASGTTRKNIALYVRKSKDAPWMLLLYRATNSSSVIVKAEDGGVIAFSKNGKKLFFIPSESLNLGFDPSEQ